MIVAPLPDSPFSREQARAAVNKANLPTLLPVLYQLTGDSTWLSEPFLPTRTRGLDPHDSGGFRPDVADQIREGALAAIDRWGQGAPVAIPEPSDEDLLRMLNVAMGEPVPKEYAQLAASELRRSVPDVPSRDFDDEPTGLSAIIIGAGISGLLASVRLHELGVPHVILEKAADLGGTWNDNRYPGAGVDTPSYLYSFSFFPSRWSTHYAKQPEVLDYLQRFADEFRIRDHISFDSEVVRAAFDETSLQWTVTVRSADGQEERLQANLLISAVGFLNQPRDLAFPGLDSFRGTAFHSARWPPDLDLHGKRVAVVGTGASSVQIAPTIADQVERLFVFQRTPQWLAPAAGYFAKVSDEVHWLMEHVPFYHFWYRLRLAWIFNDKVHASLQKDSEWHDAEHSLNAVNAGHRRSFIRHALKQLDGRADLQDKVVPTYPPFGKRMLLDNHWYRTLKRRNVELVTDPVAGFTESGIVTRAGETYDVDVAVLATGFRAQEFLYPMDIRGRGGLSLTEWWEGDNARAYLGMTTPHFPNLFLLYGPNTNAAGGSYIFLAECQVHYLAELIGLMRAKAAGAVEAREEVFEEYNADLDRAHANMIWTHPGMSTYYRNARGRVVGNSPWTVIDYWELTRAPDPTEYLWEPELDPKARA